MEYPFNEITRLHCKAYYQLYRSIADTLLGMPRKNVLKFRQFPKNFCKGPFYLKLKACSSEFLTKQETTPGKVFPLSVLKKMEICQEKVYIEVILLK